MKLIKGAVLVQYGFAIIGGIMPPFLPSELFPTNVKSYASIISSIAFGLASFGTNKAFVNITSVVAGSWLVWPSSANIALSSGEIFPDVTPSEIATMVALMDLGAMISPIPTSYLINMLGRKMVINFTAVLFIAASLLTMFATGMWYIYLARLLAGMGKGIAFSVVPVYLTEIAQLNLRGTMGSLLMTAMSLGMCFGYVIGASLSYESVNIVNLVVAIFFLTVGWLLPETPFYLLMKENEKKAEKSMSILRHTHREDDRIKAEMKQVRTAVDLCKNDKARFVDIVSSKSRRRALLIVVVTSLAQRLVGTSPVVAFGTSILPPNGLGLRPDIFMIIFAVIVTVVSYIGAVLCETCGRKKLMLYSAFGTGIVNFTIAVYFNLGTNGVDTSSLTWLPYACLVLYAILWSIGLGIMPPFLPSELFPTSVKSFASSISSIALGLASLGTNKVFGEVYLMHGGIETMFYFFGSCSFLLCILFFHYVIETKGKTFHEIQRILKEATEEE